LSYALDPPPLLPPPGSLSACQYLVLHVVFFSPSPLGAFFASPSDPLFAFCFVPSWPLKETRGFSHLHWLQTPTPPPPHFLPDPSAFFFFISAAYNRPPCVPDFPKTFPLTLPSSSVVYFSRVVSCRPCRFGSPFADLPFPHYHHLQHNFFDIEVPQLWAPAPVAFFSTSPQRSV